MKTSLLKKLWLTVAMASVAWLPLGTGSMAHAAETGKLQIEGSTTVGPIADAFAEAFNELMPEVDITVKKTGSGDGAAALVDDRCDIASMSRFMKPKEFTLEEVFIEYYKEA